MATMVKVCFDCGQTLALDQFPVNPNAPDGHRSTCASCIQRRRTATKKACDRCGEIKPLFLFPRSNGSFDGHRRTCKACLDREREERRAERRRHTLESHQLGGCLRTLLNEVGPHLLVENVNRPGSHTSLASVLDLYARTAPDKLSLPAELVYSEHYLECLQDDLPFPPNDLVATVYLVVAQGRHPLYQVLAPAEDSTQWSGQVALPPLTLPEPEHPFLPTGGLAECRQWARSLLQSPDGWVLLALETTGLWPHYHEIVEVAAVDLAGVVLVNSLMRPTRPLPSHIRRKTGITPRALETAPTLASLYSHLLEPLLTSRKVLLFSAALDLSMLHNQLWRQCQVQWQPVAYASLQIAYQTYTRTHAPCSLERACRAQRILGTQTHRALDECIASLALLRAMAGV